MVMIGIDAHKDRTRCGLVWGITADLSTVADRPIDYYAAKRRAPSARTVHDQQLRPEILRVFEENLCVYVVLVAEVQPSLFLESLNIGFVQVHGREEFQPSVISSVCENRTMAANRSVTVASRCCPSITVSRSLLSLVASTMGPRK
jgi:hypothetical protein